MHFSHKVRLHILYHCKNSKTTPFIICYSEKINYTDKEKYIICATLSNLVYEKEIADEYVCKIPYDKASPILSISFQDETDNASSSITAPKNGSFFVAVRGTYSVRDIHTNYKLIKNCNLHVNLKQVDTTVNKIEHILRQFAHTKAHYFLTGHSAGGIYTLKLLNNLCYQYNTTVYNFNPAIIKPHLKQLQTTISKQQPPPNIKVYVYRAELDIVSHQFRLCEKICDKKWMTVIVVDEQNHHLTQNNEHKSNSWIKEVLESHTIYNFINMRELLHDDTIIKELVSEYTIVNKKIKQLLNLFLIQFKICSMVILAMLQHNLQYKYQHAKKKKHRTNSVFELTSTKKMKKKRTKRYYRSQKQRSLNLDTIWKNYKQLLK